MGVPVGNLSGGQRQAMALLMSTMTPIEFLILDEHTAALDPKTAETVMRVTRQVVEEARLTTLMVTHNMHHAITHGNRLIMMMHGRIVADIRGEQKQSMTVERLLAAFEHESLEPVLAQP